MDSAARGVIQVVISVHSNRQHQDCIEFLGENIKVWNVSTGECISVRRVIWVFSVAFNHDGTKIASGVNDKASKCGMSVRANAFLPWRVAKRVVVIAFNHDGTKLHRVLDKSIKVWNVVQMISTKRVIQILSNQSIQP